MFTAQRRARAHRLTNTTLQDGVNFIDVTDEFQSGAYGALHTTRIVRYPGQMHHEQEVSPLAADLSKANMKKNLEHFTSFHTRYYKSHYGIESAEWLYSQVSEVVQESGATKYGASVERFAHPWGQFSIIARIPGQTNNTVVLGAHQDSINLFLPSILAAPGADDDGSGTVTILETFRALLRSEAIVKGQATNTIEFHWYSAEEGGLLGSQAVYSKYKKDLREVKAMLQQDMTGYVQGTLDAGEKESVGVIVDYVDQGLTAFIKQVITTVSISNNSSPLILPSLLTLSLLVLRRPLRRNQVRLRLLRPRLRQPLRLPIRLRHRVSIRKLGQENPFHGRSDQVPQLRSHAAARKDELGFCL